MKNSWRRYGALATELGVKFFSNVRLKFFLFTIGVLCLSILVTDRLFAYVRDQQIAHSLSQLRLDLAVRELTLLELRASLDHTQLMFGLWLFLLVGTLAYIFGGVIQRPVEKAMRARRQFTADAAHDLRTPLSIMKTDIELGLRQQTDNPEELRAALRSNLQEVERMTKIIEDLLSLARLDNPKLQLVFAETDMVELIYHVTTKLRQLAADEEVTLQLRTLDPCVVMGNGSALERMLMNVLSNAIDHTPPGGTVSVTLVRQQSTTVLTVADSGAGIAQHDLPHIFDRFYKASANRQGAGSGLGLAIVREIIKRHAGRIRVDSEPGKGTNVRLELPAVKQRTAT